MCLVLSPCFGHEVKLRCIHIYTIRTCSLCKIRSSEIAKSAAFTDRMKQVFDLFSFVVAETDFLQHSEPSFMETTTIEVDPVTQERYIELQSFSFFFF